MIHGWETVFDTFSIVKRGGFNFRVASHHLLAEDVVCSLEFDTRSRLRVSAADYARICILMPDGANHFLED